jgi:hypothetical protein
VHYLKNEEIFRLPCTDPQFLTHVFLYLLDVKKDHFLVQLLDLPNEAGLSFLFDLSAVQESFRFRALHRARRLSLALIDEKGDVKQDFLKKIITLFEQEGYIFFPQGSNDGTIQEHMIGFLRILSQEEILKSLKRFQKPLCHKWAEKLVFETLGLNSTSALTDAQIRAAVLCACLTPLRQNVGSCFATAPAMIIQKEQVPLFLDDLYQLLSTGKLKRTFGGTEYAIPLSPNIGIGDLKRNLIAKGSKVKAGYCPGLIAAMQVAGAIVTNLPIEELGEKVQELIQAHALGKNQLTAADLIRQVLLEKLLLTEEEIERSRGLEIAHSKSAKMIIGGADTRGSRKLEQIGVFKQKEKEARAAFNGMCDNALLKCWEFTLASFSEVKMEFSRWNLYTSLGLSPEEHGGIGEVIYRKIDEKIKELNKKIEEYQKQYEIAFDQVRATEVLLRNAASESDARRLQAEYQSRAYHMRTCLEMRDAVYSTGSNYSNLFSFLIKEYDRKFPDYFQEIYDAEMQDFQGDMYDDNPAGFRLVYKHGRADPSTWTLIYDAEEYIEVLLNFFSTTESQIFSECDWGGGQQEILEITSAIIAHIRTPVFLETAFQRMAKAHKAPLLQTPLKNLQAIEKKPWAYTSGGTMTTLLKTYYCRENELASEEKWVESESELLIFILDTLKNLPPKITDAFLKDSRKAMLMASPSHAFLLLPGQEFFRLGWQEEIFTYTWVRDSVFLPSQHFYTGMSLGAEEQSFLFSRFSEELPPLQGHYLNQVFMTSDKKLPVVEWRKSLLDAWIHRTQSPSSQQRAFADEIDAFLYQTLPLVSGKEWKMLVRRILSDLMNDELEKTLQLFPDVPSPLMTASEVRDAAKGCYLLSQKKIALPFDLHLFVAMHARFVGVAPPTPLLFADTNWTNHFFGFVVNPGSGRLELWRLDRTLSQGVQMSAWKHWLNGSDRKTWSIYTRPFEYEMSAPARL